MHADIIIENIQKKPEIKIIVYNKNGHTGMFDLLDTP